jgi:perosamine synthetase
VITTGEGGMVLTGDDEYARQLRLLRQHGMSVPDTVRHDSPELIIERYLCVGHNYRMSDLHAAVGLAQLARLDELVAQRRALAAVYDAAFADDALVEPPYVPEYAWPNYQSYVLRLRGPAAEERSELLAALRRRGIAAKPGIMVIHREPAFHGRCSGGLTYSEQLSDQSLLLPLYPSLNDAEQQQVIEALRTALHGLGSTMTVGAPCAGECS